MAATILATIVSLDPIYAEFNIDEQSYLKIINSATDTDVSKVPVQVTLAGDNAPTINGFMKSFDNKLDTKSGTIRARAVIENKDGKLIPGLFAKIRFGSTDKQKVTLITDRAVGTDQDKKFVLVVNAQNKIEYRPVVLGVNVEGLRVVESGLQEGEKIIVSGLFKYRPDMLVAPQEVPMNASEGMAQPIAEEGK
jgi:multidrug efflux system membrane fusion protein